MKKEWSKANINVLGVSKTREYDAETESIFGGNNYCGYCGKHGHHEHQCPNKKPCPES